MATETKTRPVTFISFASDLLVIREPKRPRFIRGEGGLPEAAGVTDGDRAQFEHRKFTTDNPEMIDYLRNHELFNHQRGFREDYDSARPTLEQQIDAITNFAVEADIDGLRVLIAAEETHGDGGRANVLGPARTALMRLEEQRERVSRIEQEEAAREDAERQQREAAEREQTAGDSSEGETTEEPSAEADVSDDENGADGSHPSSSD